MRPLSFHRATIARLEAIEAELKGILRCIELAHVVLDAGAHSDLLCYVLDTQLAHYQKLAAMLLPARSPGERGQ